jgi:ABC-type multidrug transport system ATPase subunit
VLRVDSLSHSYGTSQVIIGAFLTCRPGEIVGILGRNGSGKTTLLRSIFGSLRPDHIHLEIDGVLATSKLRSSVMSLLPQSPYLPRTLTVGRALSLSLPSYDPAEATAEFPLLESLLLQESRRVADLSGGEQRLLELYIALSLPVRYSLLDEPFTEVDPATRAPIAKFIEKTARSKQRGIILTDHAYRDVVLVSDQLMVMSQGDVYRVNGEGDLTHYGYTPHSVTNPGDENL